MAFCLSQPATAYLQNLLSLATISRGAKNKATGGSTSELALITSKRCFSGISTKLLRNAIISDYGCILPRRLRKNNSIFRLQLGESLNLNYHLASSKFYIQRRGFRTEHINKTEAAKKSYLGSIFGWSNKKREGLQKKKNTRGFQERLKLVQDGDKKGFMEGYVTAMEYSHEEKSKRSQLKNVLLSTALLAFGLYFIIKAVGLPPSLFSSVEEVDPENINVKFKDVQGIDEAKLELDEIVSYLSDPDKYMKMGARLPKGVLLIGPPGTGKTLLARAIAGEAQVPFFQASGSEFDELFVGQGARRIRELFTRAKEKSPCIIFIDEIDSVGSKRIADSIHPHANQTVNQLLAEMDGFNTTDGVIVIGATNRVDDLDPALLRPGRFDVHVQVPFPDLEGRKDIIKLYLDRVDHEIDICTDTLARGTTGFTGADIENMINQAALRAAADGCIAVTNHHIEHAKDRVMMGPARLRGRLPDEDANKITAYHEAGHALVSILTKDAIPMHKVTIIPRGTSLGHTAMIPEKDEYHVSKAQMLAQLDTLMGGRVAEELIFGSEKITTGASDDLKKATNLATKMVKVFGMSDRVGLRIADDESKSLISVNQLSPAVSELIDKEISRILKESYDRAKELLTKNKRKHVLLAESLLEYETLTAEEVKELFANGRIQPHLEKSKTRTATFLVSPQVLITPLEKKGVDVEVAGDPSVDKI